MSDEHVHLREYIERILDEREKAIGIASKNIELRLDHLNNLRSEVEKDRSTFLSKAVYDQMHGDLVRRVEVMEAKFNRAIGVSTVLVVLAGITGGLIGHFTK